MRATFAWAVVAAVIFGMPISSYSSSEIPGERIEHEGDVTYIIEHVDDFQLLVSKEHGYTAVSRHSGQVEGLLIVNETGASIYININGNGSTFSVKAEKGVAILRHELIEGRSVIFSAAFETGGRTHGSVKGSFRYSRVL